MACARRRCGHARQYHTLPAMDPAACRVTGCECEQYTDPQAAGLEHLVGGEGKQVTIDIPEGHYLNVQVLPMPKEEFDADAG